jgi:hypothetical protein
MHSGVMKICTKCGEEKLNTDFHKSKNGKNGTRGDCKLCRKKYKAKNYQENVERFKVRNKLWFQENKERRREYEKKRSKLLKRRLAASLRTRLREAIKDNYETSLTQYIGCSIKELRIYLESKFKSGMTWENYGLYGWHIDHVRPLSSFDLTDEKEITQACHYTNLQPLWCQDNLSKGNRYEAN